LGYRQRAEFLKTDLESLFPGGSRHFSNFYLAPSWAEKTRLESSNIDPRGFAMAETSFCHGKTSRIRVATFWTGFLSSGWCKTSIKTMSNIVSK
jgi:hypothetical protein